MLWLLCLACFVSFGQTAVWNLGACPDIPGMDNFDLTKYMGTWFEYSNVFEIFQIGAKCVRAQYAIKGETISVKNEQVNMWWNSYQQVQGSARPADPAKPNKAELVVTFEGIPFQSTSSGKVAPNYSVVDTDYTTYAIVYQCTTFPVWRRESLWVLTRRQVPEQALVDSVYKKMTSLGLPVQNLEKTEQEGCSLLP
ncbi:apolipoprotein D [Eurytemora carolleeae]|uniref:apolipoprotein D n=1 Tax=Eurytemora carolleeae TaxID=1294199 RepID=UPI000C75DAE0|nr:apolipoprotein D [Eurytemora carolleeae]|eukprot:XP_023342265.1 apolipoprotein D-like [Eurytemora affinis]